MIKKDQGDSTSNRQSEKGEKKETDPQESMRGPLSSLVQKIKEGAEENDEKEQKMHEQKENNTGGDFINE